MSEDQELPPRSITPARLRPEPAHVTFNLSKNDLEDAVRAWLEAHGVPVLGNLLVFAVFHGGCSAHVYDPEPPKGEEADLLWLSDGRIVWADEYRPVDGVTVKSSHRAERDTFGRPTCQAPERPRMPTVGDYSGNLGA